MCFTTTSDNSKATFAYRHVLAAQGYRAPRWARASWEVSLEGVEEASSYPSTGREPGRAHSR